MQHRITEMFRDHLADLFAEGSVFEDDGDRKLRVTRILPQGTHGRRTKRPVAITFEPKVIREMEVARANKNLPREDRIGDRVTELVVAGLRAYDPNGPIETAHQIYVDDRALDQ